MHYREKNTFFLYGVGYNQDQLCLGNLVLKDYANPTTSRHYEHVRLSNEELRNHAYVDAIPKDFKHTEASGHKVTIGADVAEIVTLKFPLSSDRTKILTAPSGHRIQLKNSEYFFYNQVLRNQKAHEKLSVWISAAHSDRISVLSMFPPRKPRIWLLTGLYTFKDATCTEISNLSLGAEVAISSVLALGAGGPPIGPEGSISVDRGLQNTLPMAGDLVWAAQWQLLDLKGVWLKAGIEKSKSKGWMVPLSVTLYEDRFSSGALKAGGGEEVAFLEARKRFYDKEDVPELAKSMGMERAVRLVKWDEEQEEEQAREDVSVKEDDEYDRLLEETIQYFEKSIAEERTKDADPDYQARKRAALEAKRKADEQFNYACTNFPVGSKERKEARETLEKASAAVRQFELKKIAVPGALHLAGFN